MEETLSKVLGVFIIESFSPKITIHRLPVSLKKELDKGPILVVAGLNIIDQ
jgi:hypothetical protein